VRWLWRARLVAGRHVLISLGSMTTTHRA
jgi:hypothetical protein